MADEPIKDDLVKDDTGPPQQSDADKAESGERIPSTAEVEKIATTAAQKVNADATVKANAAAVAASYREDLKGVMDTVLDGDKGIKDIADWKRDAIHRAAADRVATDNPDLDGRDKKAVHAALKEATAKIIAEDGGPAAESSEDQDDVKKRVAALDGGAGAGGGRSAGQGSGESEKIIAGGFDELHSAGLTMDGTSKWPKEDAINRDTEKAADKFLAAAPRD